jgi:hypothetical protein
LKPHVVEFDGLESCEAAIESINGRRSTGKIVIRVRPGER